MALHLASAEATHLSAGVLVPQSLNVPFQVRVSPSRLCLPKDTAASRDTARSPLAGVHKRGVTYS
jgi:hypothetical protein